MARIIQRFDAFHPADRLPTEARVIPSKWVFKTKPARLKARLVATESLARYDIPDKFSPTIALSTFRFLLAFSCLHHCDLQTMDIAGAYLFAPLEAHEQIYLRTPSHFHDLGLDFLD